MSLPYQIISLQDTHRGFVLQPEKKPIEREPYQSNLNSEPESPEYKLTHAGNFINGFLCNMGMISVMQPVFTLKTYLMSGHGIPPLTRLYNGSLVNCLSAGSAEGVAFLTYHAFLRTFQKDYLDAGEDFVCSSVSGAISAPINCACERPMILQQLHNKTLIEAIKPIVWKEGRAKAFLKGVTPTIGRDAIFNCGVFFLFNSAKKALQPYVANEKVCTTAAGVLGGGAAGVLSTPFDVVKTKMQADTTNQFTSMRRTAYHILKIEGYKGLFRGCAVRAGLIGGAITIIDLSKEKIPRFFPEYLREEG